MKLPAECAKCKNKFDLQNDISEQELSRNFQEVLKEKFGSDITLLCEICR